MCTASWFSTPDGFELFFNRDERRTRLPAEPPRRRETSAGTAFLAPIDGDAGGTWIGVNSRGVALALLNGFPAGADSAPTEPAGGDWTSRGHVIPRLMDAGSTAAAMRDAGRLPLERFRPMLVLALDPAGRVGVADWSGRELTVRAAAQAPAPPLISSSFCSDEVRATRLATWGRIVHGTDDGADAHRRFHGGHLPERGPYSVCMHRPDARTVSFTRIAVDAEGVRIVYTDDAPCRGRPGDAVALPRSES